MLDGQWGRYDLQAFNISKQPFAIPFFFLEERNLGLCFAWIALHSYIPPIYRRFEHLHRDVFELYIWLLSNKEELKHTIPIH
jgi:hypothetical protein